MQLAGIILATVLSIVTIYYLNDIAKEPKEPQK